LAGSGCISITDQYCLLIRPKVNVLPAQNRQSVHQKRFKTPCVLLLCYANWADIVIYEALAGSSCLSFTQYWKVI